MNPLIEQLTALKLHCQIAFKTDPGLASKIDPPNGLVMSLFLTVLKTVRVIMSFDN